MVTLNNISFVNNFKFSLRLSLENWHIQNAPELIQNLSPSTIALNLGGNYVGKLNDTTFSRLINLQWLSLINTNLSFDDLKPFKPLKNLKPLDISFNSLKTVDLASLDDDENIRMIYTDYDNFGSRLETLKLSNNNLTELNNFKQSPFRNPFFELDISQNRLSCEFLVTSKE